MSEEDKNPIVSANSVIQGAAGLVVALAWNEAAEKFIDVIIPFPQNKVIATIVYAVFVTIIVIAFVAIYNKIRSNFTVIPMREKKRMELSRIDLMSNRPPN